MRKFAVDVDITVTTRVHGVEAEDEESAKAFVNERMGKDPHHYIMAYDAYLGHDITCAFEESDDD